MSKTKLNQIANGTCPECGGPLNEIDIELQGFDQVYADLECENCFNTFRVHFDIVDWEKRI